MEQRARSWRFALCALRICAGLLADFRTIFFRKVEIAIRAMEIHPRPKHVRIDDENLRALWTCNFDRLTHGLPHLYFQFWILRLSSVQVLDFRFLRKWTISSGRFPHPRPLPEGEGRGEGFLGHGRSIMIHDNWGADSMVVSSSALTPSRSFGPSEYVAAPHPARTLPA